MQTKKILITGKVFDLSTCPLVGEGGEAQVFKLNHRQAVKIFKKPNHPDFTNCPAMKQAAEQRLLEHQTKLRDFPRNLPAGVVTPQELVFDPKQAHIIGYTMAYLDSALPVARLSDKTFRQNLYTNGEIASLFLRLRTIIQQLHDKQVVVGDLNDLNVLISGGNIYLIDSDSFQFAKYACRLFTERFLDPLLLAKSSLDAGLSGSYSEDSDWYAFNTMLFEALLCTGPFGGVFRDGKRQLSFVERVAQRITVMDPGVIYPKPALPFAILPDTILHEFLQTFKLDRRQIFPAQLLDSLEWHSCSSCGLQIAREHCPRCQKTPIQPVVSIQFIGSIGAHELFTTSGHIVCSLKDPSGLHWIVRRDASLFDEKNNLLGGDLPGTELYLLHNGSICLCRRGLIHRIRHGRMVSQIAVDTGLWGPLATTNGRQLFFVQDGVLYQGEADLAHQWGTLISSQAWIQTGSSHGFGFYRARQMLVGFIFSTTARGILDSLSFPNVSGHLLSSEAAFGDDRIWWKLRISAHGVVIRRLHCFSLQGGLLGWIEQKEGEPGWLGRAGSMLACGDKLLLATDEGIIRVEIRSGAITQTHEFPDTEHFVDSSAQLHLGSGGLYVVTDTSVRMISQTGNPGTGAAKRTSS